MSGRNFAMIKKNHFLMTGIIVGKHERNDGATGYTVATKSGVTAYVGIIDHTGADFPIKTRVKAEGHIEGWAYKDDKDNRIKMNQYFIADSIEKEKDLIEEGFNVDGGHFYPEPSFIYYVGGKVTHVGLQNDFLHLQIETDNTKGKTATINVSARESDVLPEVHKGDNILCACGVFTKNRGYRNLTISDISVLPAEEEPA